MTAPTSTPAPDAVREIAKRDTAIDSELRELFSMDEEDPPLSDRIQVCEGFWVRALDGSFQFQPHPEPEACSNCTVSIEPARFAATPAPLAEAQEVRATKRKITMTLNLTEQEMAELERLSVKKNVPKPSIFLTAFRLYQSAEVLGVDLGRALSDRVRDLPARASAES